MGLTRRLADEYDAALNEGRAQFHPDDDKGFGQWVADNLLRQVVGVEINDHERAAAMWAAGNREQFEATGQIAQLDRTTGSDCKFAV